MEVITIHNKKYQVMNNYKDAINIEELESKLTDYFDDFDYIFFYSLFTNIYYIKMANLFQVFNFTNHKPAATISTLFLNIFINFIYIYVDILLLMSVIVTSFSVLAIIIFNII